MSFRAPAPMTLGDPDLGIPVVELLRVSTEEQAADTRAGLDRQRAVNQRTIEAKGLQRIATIELRVSGTVAMNHPEMRRVLGMVSDGTIKGIVCSDLDRLFRPDQPSSYAILQIFQDMDAKIYTGDSVYDLQTSNGLLQSSIRGAIAGFELALIRERMQGAKEAKRRQGKCPTNQLTLPLGIGYDRKTDSWHYTPEIAKVKLIFDLFLQYGVRNYSELGRQVGLTNAGVKLILKNRLYTGWRVIDQKRGPKRTSSSGKLYRVKVPRADNEVVRVKVLDGILSEELFEQVQREIAITKFNFIERYRSSDEAHLTTGLAICACCGRPMFLTGRGKSKIPYVVCKANYYLYREKMGGCVQPHIREDVVEAALVHLVSTLLTDPANLANILESSAQRSRELITPFSKTVGGADQLHELSRRDQRLVTAYEQGVITVDELRTKRQALHRERALLEKTLQPRHAPNQTEFLTQARLVVKAALRLAECCDKHQQKKIMRELLAEVHIRQKQIISFRFRAAVFGENTAQETVLLSKPLWIGSPPDMLPEGHRRCIKCFHAKPLSDFYRNLNRCNDCRKASDRAGYQRRKQSRGSG